MADLAKVILLSSTLELPVNFHHGVALALIYPKNLFCSSSNSAGFYPDLTESGLSKIEGFSHAQACAFSGDYKTALYHQICRL
jgi:hypothetical protein